MSAAVELDFTEFYRKLDRTKTALRRDLALAVRRACDHGVRVAKQGTFKDQTGQLRATITTHVLGWRGNTFWMQIHAPMPYAHFVDAGTKPHDILPLASYAWAGLKRRPRGPGTESVVGRGYALRWKDSGGMEHFARIVHHRGTKANRFFETAIDATRLKLAGELMRGEFSNIRSVWS